MPASNVNPPVFNKIIDQTAFAAEMADIANELTNSLDRLGRSPMQAVLAMGGFKISNVGAPVAQTDAARLADLATYLQPGAVQIFAMSVAPAGWLACDGSAVSRVTYANLFAAVGVVHGPGDGTTTFNVPDLRGRFPRGWDNGAGVDPARVFGSVQADALGIHVHTTDASTGGVGIVAGSGATQVPLFLNSATGSTGGTETVPKNVALLFCIRT